MFIKGTLRDNGIDITIKNNPGHFLSPDNWDMVMGVKFDKIPYEEYKTYYLNLIKKRWESRKKEFLALALEGKSKNIILKCFCPTSANYCHAFIAADFMNKLVEKI